MLKQGLTITDVQNDYFDNGKMHQKTKTRLKVSVFHTMIQ